MEGDANLMGYRSWRPARDIIDWSIPGDSIFGRKRPLAENTVRRIASGIKKYWKGSAEPFLAVLYGTNDVRSLDRPFPTITGSGAHHALVEPFIFSIGHYSAGNRIRSLNKPLSTIVVKAEHCLVEPGMCLDIRFRMLKCHELKRAHSFPDGYVLKGNAKEQARQIGNSVPVMLAKALAKSVMG